MGRWALGLGVLLGSAEAEAQSTFAVEVFLGGGLPIGPAVHQAAFVEEELLGGGRTGSPGLWRLYPGAGLQLGARIVTGATEFGYQLLLGPWSHAWRECEGTPSTVRLPDGSLEDGDVTWACGADQQRRNLGSVPSSALVQHDVGAAQRFRLELTRDAAADVVGSATRSEPVATLYLVAGGGATVASWRVAGAGGSIHAGAYAVAGGGMELPFSQTWGVLLDLRYRFAIRGTPAPFSSSAAHARARDATVLSALADWSQHIGVTISLRYRFR
jgi:hypothetical protein